MSENLRESLRFNADELTLNQLDFLTEYTRRSVDELIEVIQSQKYYGRDLIAVVAVAMNPDDPGAALDDVRKIKASDVDLDFQSEDN